MAKHIKPSEKKKVMSGAIKAAADKLSISTRESTVSAEPTQQAPLRELGSIAAAFIIALILRFLPFKAWVRIVLSLVPLITAGCPVFRAAMREAMGFAFWGSEFLVSVASIGCLALGECMEAVALMCVFRLCSLARLFMEAKKAARVKAFAEKWPKNAAVQKEDGIDLCPVEQVEVGEVIVVSPGEIIPLDGIVVEGISSVSTERISSKGYELIAAPGSELCSGCLNITNALRVRVARSSSASMTARLSTLTENAAEGKTKRVFMAEKAAKLYTPAMAVIALILAIVPTLITKDWSTWIHRAIFVLIISDPTALVFSLSLAYFGGIYSAAENGIFFKESDYLEKLAKAQSMVFEKTGIVTDARFTVTDVFPVGMSEEKLLAVASAAELCSCHPIARAICSAGNSSSLREEIVSEFEEQPGKGVYALIAGHPIFVGTGIFLSENGINYSVPSKPGTAVHVAMDGEYCGHILLADRVRAKAFDALEALRLQGVDKFVLLTGDVKSSTRRIASSLNFDLAKFEVDPDGKKAAIASLKALDQGASVLAFVGSGADDAVAMDEADVGIAFHALSNYEALNRADVLIMDENIENIPAAMKTAKNTFRAASINIIAFAAASLLLFILGAAGVFGLWTAIIAEVFLFAGLNLNAMRTDSLQAVLKHRKGKKS